MVIKLRKIDKPDDVHSAAGALLVNLLDHVQNRLAALMQEQGHDVLYWENMEGGHAGAANNVQQALMWALTYSFLLGQLK